VNQKLELNMNFEFSNERSESALHKLNLITVSINFEMKLTLKPSSGIGNLVLTLALVPFGFSGLQSYEQTSFFDTESEERGTLAVSNPQLINEFWAGITGAKSGSMIGIGSDVMNYSSDEMTFTFIVQIKDQEGITVLLMSLQDLSASPNHPLKPAVFWLPEEDGHYQAEIFVWQSVNSPVPLAPISTVSFNVY
jgi:hypothetical protein